MTSELEFGDRTFIDVQTGPKLPDLRVWNFAGQPVKVRGNSGEGDIYLRSSVSYPMFFMGKVRDRQILDPFKGHGEEKTDWAIISLDLSPHLGRKPHNWRITTWGDPQGIPLLCDGASHAVDLFGFGFRLWPLTDEERELLGEVDFASTDPVAVQV